MRVRPFWLILALAMALALAAVVFLKSASVRAIFFADAVTPETKGYRLAIKYHCFRCHAHEGAGGISNPGAESSEIPSWQGFSFMMSMKNESELREWIMDGAPHRISSSQNYAQRQLSMAVPMPAYRQHIDQSELDDLVAFYEAVSGLIWPDDPEAEKGYKAARDAGCFSCHGLGGRIDVVNKGSFAGFIPAWTGSNYTHLVRSEDELDQWIHAGTCDRILNDPVAQFFQGQQILKMPGYQGKLSEDQINSIKYYIGWLRDDNAPGKIPQYQL